MTGTGGGSRRGDPYERIVAADGRPGIYESNYLKGNARDGCGAFWVKHNVLVPADGSALPAVAEFWCVLWLAADGWRPRVWKRVAPLGSVRLAGDRVEIEAESVHLRPGRASGELPGPPAVSWELAIEDELPPLRHFGADWMYEKGFPRKKLVTGSPRAIFTGRFTIGDRSVAVDRWVGHRNHNWGTEHAERYAYGSCSLWEDGADLTVEGFTVQVRLVGPLRSPWSTLVRGMDGAVPYGEGSLHGMLRHAGDVDWPVWTAWTGGRRGRVRLEMALDPAHAAGLRYLHPDGRLSYCYNAKDATVDLLLGGVRHRSRGGELEFLFPDPIDGIALHGEATVEELADAAG
ncbi:MAG: hypothetical protein ACRDUY_13485 [Nitriliruptorales bacterium]